MGLLLIDPPEKSCVEKCKTDHPENFADYERSGIALEYIECFCKCENHEDCSGANTFDGNLISTTAIFLMISQLIRWYAT